MKARVTASECRERAEKCLAAAQAASDGEAQRHWRQLADMWLSWSKKLDKFRVINQKLEAAKSTTEWPAAGSEDTELGVFMGPEVSHGETKVYAGVQA